MSTIIKDSDFHEIEDFTGSTVTIDGEKVSFIAKVHGKDYRFIMDPAEAFKMGAWLIASFKCAAHLVKIPEEQRLTPQFETVMATHLRKTMDVIEKHLSEDLDVPPKKDVPYNVMMRH